MTLQATDDLNPSNTNNFAIVISSKDGEQVSYFARSVTLPGWDVGAIETPYRNQQMAMPGNSRARDTLVVEFILSEKLTNFKMIRKWGRTALKGAGPITECMKDITIVMLDSNKQPLDSIKYAYCYPSNVSNLTLEAGVVDTMPQTFTVTFLFEDEEWE